MLNPEDNSDLSNVQAELFVDPDRLPAIATAEPKLPDDQVLALLPNNPYISYSPSGQCDVTAKGQDDFPTSPDPTSITNFAGGD